LEGDRKTTNKYLITALLIGVVFHGASMFFTLEATYDALIHLFFGNHYANSWFEPWNYSWYTGFTVMGYPPLVHQAIAIFSYVGGLKFGLFAVVLLGVLLFITGVYRFSLLLSSNRKVAGYAAILAVFSSSFVETLHIFGQLPSIIGISILMHALPEIYLWIKTGKLSYFATSLSLIAVTVTSHHVTPIFGMVFFIFPLIGLVIMDASREKVNSIKEVTFSVFLKTFMQLLKRIISFGLGSLVLIIVCILPYWINTKNNPITQVPIPHGSRDNFLEVTSSGLMFFLIPWGIMLLLFPYLWYRFFSKRYLFFGLSISLLTLLGTGGTTPIPRMLLGDNAFNILTLDRFTLWASIMALPIFGEFTYRFVEGDLKDYLQDKFGSVYHRIIGGLLAVVFIFATVFTLSLGNFRPSQPEKIKMLPILNFLKQDQHDHWRYLPLGFGDQMAWLSSQTRAMTVDGNYHSARRLPELTTRAVERLENSKYSGVEGIGSLQQFLAVPEKYNLKYVFSNDKFYDPILYFWYFEFRILYEKFNEKVVQISYVWGIFMVFIFGFGLYVFYSNNATQISPNNVVKAYYDALDFKEFEKAYSYIDPQSGKSMDQYMLEVAVTDGVLSSYAKLDEIKTEIISQNDSLARLKVCTQWITPLEKIEKTYHHEVVQRHNKWFVKPTPYDLDIPPDQLFAENMSVFHNHGRRRISSEQTYHEDVLKQPVLEVLSAKIVASQNQYHIIGTLQNIDNVPADVVVKGTLYDQKDKKLASFNAKHQIKHKLMPKETTSFRINFEDIAWQENTSIKPKIFDPDEFTTKIFNDIPDKFNLQCAGNVANVDLYKGVAIQELSIYQNALAGILFNAGVQEVTIPQLLISYYDKDKNLVWVDHSYLQEGIRPQRKKYFEYSLLDLSTITAISSSMENVFVNGLSNQEISKKVVLNRLHKEADVSFVEVNGKGYKYIKMEINSYIGKPN